VEKGDPGPRGKSRLSEQNTVKREVERGVKVEEIDLNSVLPPATDRSRREARVRKNPSFKYRHRPPAGGRGLRGRRRGDRLENVSRIEENKDRN